MPHPGRLRNLPSVHPFVVNAGRLHVHLYRPGRNEVAGLHPRMCTPLGDTLFMEQAPSWNAWNNATVCTEELKIAGYTRSIAAASEDLFPVKAVLGCVQDLARATNMPNVLEDFVFYCSLFFWLNVRGRFFARTPSSYAEFSEQRPPFIYLFFYQQDMASAHSTKQNSNWARNIEGCERDLAGRLSFADFMHVAMVRYTTKHRDIGNFISHTLRKNFWMMMHSRGFGRMLIHELAEQFKAAADMAGAPQSIEFKIVHLRAGDPLWVRKECARKNVAVPGFWTHILLHPRMEIVPRWVATVPNRAYRLCLVRACLGYFLPPQEFSTLRQKLIPFIRQIARAPELAQCVAVKYGNVDPVHARISLTAVRMRYCFFVRNAFTYLVPPLHMLPHWRLSNHDETFVDEEIAMQLFRTCRAPTRMLREFVEPPWPPGGVDVDTQLARKYFVLRNAHRLGEEEAWFVVGKPAWHELSRSIEALRAAARERLRLIVRNLPAQMATVVGHALKEWDGGSELTVPATLSLPPIIHDALDIVLRLQCAHVAVPLPNGAMWHKGLDCDVSERKDPGLAVLDALADSIARTVGMEMRSKSRVASLDQMVPGADVLSDRHVAALRALQVCPSVAAPLKRKLATLEAHALERQSSMLTSPFREVYHTFHCALRDFGRIPSDMVQQTFVYLAQHMVPQPMEEANRMLSLVVQDYPELRTSLQADVNLHHEPGSWLLRLPYVVRWCKYQRRH